MQFIGEQEPKLSEYSRYKSDANKNEELDDDDYLSETSDKDLSLKRHHGLDINNGRTNDDEDDQIYRKHRDSKNKNYEQTEDDNLNSSKRQHKTTATDNNNDESENDEQINEYMKNNNSTEYAREGDTNSSTKPKDEVCFFMNNSLSISQEFNFSKSLGYCRGNYFTKSKLYHMSFICVLYIDLKKQPPEVFCKNAVLRNFPKFTEKHLRECLCPATLVKKKLWVRCFPVNFAKFPRTAFLQNTSKRLLDLKKL